MKHVYFACIATLISFVGYSQAGTLDKNFGDNGITINTNDNFSIGYGSTTILHDDKIAVAAGMLSEAPASGVYKYLANGTLDNSFGKEGFAKLPNNANVTAIIEQSDDYKITTAGISADPSPEYARLKADGSPDSTFGKNGYFRDNSISHYQQVFDIAQQDDGKLVSCGIVIPNINTGSSFCVVTRLNQNGTLDNSFGSGGHVIFENSDFQPAAIAIQTDGKIVCAGSYQGCRLVRLNSNGVLDKTFGTNGYVITTFSRYVDYFKDLVIQSDGKIVAAGVAGDNSFNGSNPFWAIARYNVDGSIDHTFGDAGKASLKVPNSYAFAESVALQKDNKIVIGGWISFENSAFSVARFKENGIIDSSFGANGLSLSYINLPQNGEGKDVGIQSNGRIILAGFIVDKNNKYSAALVGYVGSEKQLGPIARKIRRWIRNHTLNWQDTDNGNVSYYSISQSNGISGFKEIARIKAGKNNSYSYDLNDASTNDQTTFYRVTAVNTDGRNAMSDVISFTTGSIINVSPNPAKNILRISGLSSTQKSNLSIVNRNGNIVASAVAQSSNYNFNVQSLHSGDYYLQVTVNSKTETIKFIKE